MAAYQRLMLLPRSAQSSLQSGGQGGGPVLSPERSTPVGVSPSVPSPAAAAPAPAPAPSPHTPGASREWRSSGAASGPRRAHPGSPFANQKGGQTPERGRWAHPSPSSPASPYWARSRLEPASPELCVTVKVPLERLEQAGGMERGQAAIVAQASTFGRIVAVECEGGGSGGPGASMWFMLTFETKRSAAVAADELSWLLDGAFGKNAVRVRLCRRQGAERDYAGRLAEREMLHAFKAAGLLLWRRAVRADGSRVTELLFGSQRREGPIPVLTFMCGVLGPDDANAGATALREANEEACLAALLGPVPFEALGAALGGRPAPPADETADLDAALARLSVSDGAKVLPEAASAASEAVAPPAPAQHLAVWLADCASVLFLASAHMHGSDEHVAALPAAYEGARTAPCANPRATDRMDALHWVPLPDLLTALAGGREGAALLPRAPSKVVRAWLRSGTLRDALLGLGQETQPA